MSLKAIVDAIEVRLGQKMAFLQLAAPTVKFGEAAITEHDAPPRVVFIPTRGPIRGGQGLGGDGTVNPSPLWTREVGIRIHVWGEDTNAEATKGDHIAATETLMGHLVAAIHDLMPGSYLLTSENWETAQAAVLTRGALVVLEATFKVPITREADVSVVVLTETITGTFVDP